MLRQIFRQAPLASALRGTLPLSQSAGRCLSTFGQSYLGNWAQPKSFVVDNPYTGETYAEVPLLDQQGAHALMDKASKAQKFWKTVPLDDRIALVDRFLSHFEHRAPKIAQDITGQMGKPLSASRGEISVLRERAEALMEIAPVALGTQHLPEKENFIRKIELEPVGVVLVIAPFNYPIITAANTVITAVLAGNSVLIKHSPRTPLCADHFQEAFEAAGAPEGLVSALHVDHDTCTSVYQHEALGFVNFTGSVIGGQQVYSSVAAARFIDVGLELGGKDAGYVLEDADITQAAEGLVDGAFFNAGQSCCSIERIYVARSRYDEFVQTAVNTARMYRLGDPTLPDVNMGPMALHTAPLVLKQQVEEAVEGGAHVLVGGVPTQDTSGRGRFFSPTIITNVNENMSVQKEESFGPIVTISPVDSDEQCVKLINASRYGLTTSIWTADMERAERLASQIESGTVFANRCDYLDPLLPWAGYKHSGKGVALGLQGFRNVVRTKSYHFKKR